MDADLDADSSRPLTVCPPALLHLTHLVEAQKRFLEASASMKLEVSAALAATKAELDATRAALRYAQQRPPSFEEQVARVLSAHSAGKNASQLAKEALERFGLDCTNNCNVAIAGDVGVGKSTMIRAMLGMHWNDPKAPICDVTECTAQPLEYFKAEKPRLRIWDLPGQNTLNFPAVTYFTALRLYAFDVLIVAYTAKLTAASVELVRIAMETRLPVALVRTKADQDLHSIQRCNPGMDRAGAAALLRGKVETELRGSFPKQDGNSMCRWFIVSMQDYEDRKAVLDEEALLDYLSEGASRRALAEAGSGE